MPVPNQFANVTTSIPLSQLDANFNTPITLGNTAIQLGNTVTTLNNMTLANVTVSSGNVTITNVSVTTANVTTANIANVIVTGTGTFAAGSNTAPSITTSGDTNTGIFFPAADTVAIGTGGTEALRVNSSQNVGIGTSSPATKLNVVGSISASDSTTTTKRLQLDVGASSGTINCANYGSDMLDLNIQGENLIFNTGLIGIAERMRIDSSGNVGIGTSSPSSFSTYRYLDLVGGGTSTGGIFQSKTSNGAVVNTLYTTGSAGAIGTATNHPLQFLTNDLERARITSGGDVGIGTSSPETRLNVASANADLATAFANQLISTTSAIAADIGGTLGFGGYFVGTTTTQWAAIGGRKNNATSNDYGGYLAFYTRANAAAMTERARIASDGTFMIGSTDLPNRDTTTGVYLGNGVVQGVRSSNASGDFGRLTTGGDIVVFRLSGTTQGSISGSGTTISYNSFAGSHWSQLQDGSKPEILRGTVMESINELCEWPDEPNTERLCRVKISDTEGSKKVYGVFMDWDNDWTATNDMLVTAVGAFVCRVNGSVTVQQGDLLECSGKTTLF